MNEQKEKPTLSKSKLNLLSMCGEAYRRRYVENDKRPFGVNVSKGLAFHGVAETNNKQKIETRTDLSIDDMKDIASDQIDAFFTQGVALSKEEASQGVGAVKGDAKDVTVALIPHLAEASKPIMPRTVETLQRIVIPQRSHDILFVMDIETENEEVIDYKVSGKRKNQNDADSDLGLTTYSLAYRVKNKKNPKRVVLQNYVGYKTPKKQELKTEYQELEAHRDEKDYQILLARVDFAIQKLDQGIFEPAPVGSWKCSEKFCEYFDSCKFVNQERLAAAKEQE